MADEEKTRLTVDIYNRPYTVIGSESESQVQLIASLVDQKMKEINAANSTLDTTSLAVLTAVNTMNDYMKLKEDYASLLGSIRNYKSNQKGKKKK